MRLGVAVLAGAAIGLLTAVGVSAQAAETTDVPRASAAKSAPVAKPESGRAEREVAALTADGDPAAPPQPAEAPATAPTAKPAKPKPPPPPTLHATIDLTTQRMTVKANGKTLHRWKISSGRAGYHTPRGRFRPQWMAREWYSRQYDGAPMPYSVFFNRGIATHGTNAVGMLGRPASHGCIRLRTPHARQFYNLVRKHGKSRTRIVVTGSTPATSTRVARRTRPTVRRRSVQRQRVVRPGPGQRSAVRRGWHYWDNNGPTVRRRAASRREYLPRRRPYWQRSAPRRAYRTGRRRLVFPGD